MGIERTAPWATSFVRSVALDDIRIRKGGTGRTVEAYAAVFNVPAEVMDQDGHYLEKNHPGAWNRTIAHKKGRFPVVYHHGMNLAGGASERGSVPIGVSTEVRADATGVLTISEYGHTPLADEVLESIRMGAVTAQSYGGRFLKSTPNKPLGGFRRKHTGELTEVTRMEVAMHEFGPTPFPAFADALITGVRAQQILGTLLAAPVAQRLTLLDELATPPHEVDPDGLEEDTPGETGIVQTTDDALLHSARSRRLPLATRIRAAKIVRNME